MTKQIYFCILAALAFVLMGQVAFIPVTLSGLWGVVWLTLVWRKKKQKTNTLCFFVYDLEPP